MDLQKIKKHLQTSEQRFNIFNARYQEIHDRFFVFNKETGFLEYDMTDLAQKVSKRQDSLESIFFGRTQLLRTHFAIWNEYVKLPSKMKLIKGIKKYASKYA